MTNDEFWALIAEHVTVDDVPDVSGLETALAARSAPEIVEFDRIFVTLFRESYSWNLWGAAYVINGGCSDDGFDYFRGWLIAMGPSVYERAMRDPDSLVDIAEEGVECEEMLYVAGGAYEKATGGKKLDGAPHRFPELGEGWDFDDNGEMKRRYPKLAAKFLGAS